MNTERLIRMGMRMLMRKGMQKGAQVAAARGKPPEEMTPEERQQAQSAQQLAGKVQKTARMVRRFMR